MQAALVALAPTIIGALLMTFDYVIYTFYEGRFYWPASLSKLLTRHLQEKVDSEKEDSWAKQAKRARSEGREGDFNELWFKLRNFPEDEGKDRRKVVYPTIMGNMLRQAEDYPWKRYGMDDTFYWYRLKMILPKDQSDLIENTKAQVDLLVYSSFFLAAYSPAHIIVYGMTGRLVGAFFGLLTITAAYLLYRVSLKGLRLYLEEFKSAFDVYRDKLRTVFDASNLGDREQRFWKRAWVVLQYGETAGEAVVLVTLAPNKDPVAIVNELEKAGLKLNWVVGEGDFALSGYFAASNLSEVTTKLNAIRTNPGIQNVSYFWRRPT